MNNLPVSESEEMMPYIKQRKKSAASKTVFLFAVVAIVAAIAITAFRSSEKLKSFISGIFGKAAESSESTSTTESTEGTAAEKGLYYFDSSLVPEGNLGVIPCDLSVDSLGKMFENGTDYEVGTAKGTLGKADDGKVRVLIVCTHPYEAFTADILTYYSDDFTPLGGENTVAELARSMARKLISLGIGAEYLDTGVTSGKNSYADAAKMISDYLSSHPDIIYVIDLHRGVLCDSSENLLRPVAEKDKTVYAQMKFIVGSGHDGWQSELSSVNTLFSAIYASTPALLMPTEISASRLNQHLPATVFTLEIGTCANSIEEAENTVSVFSFIFAGAVSE